MAKKRKVHSAASRPRLVAAHKGDKTINELAGQYAVHPTLIHGWKKHLLGGAEGLFSPGRPPSRRPRLTPRAAQAELFEQGSTEN